METRDRGAGHPGQEVLPVSMPVARLVTTRVDAERTGGAYSLFEVEVEPGGGEGPHVQHREDEWLYVLDGRFAFEVEGVETEAGPGTHLYVPKGAMHAYQNTGGGVGRLLTVHTPGGPQERFVETAGEFGEPGRSREQFAVLAAQHGIEVCRETETTERSL